jgi:hypothetical protein
MERPEFERPHLKYVKAAAAPLGQCFHTFVFAAYPVLIVVGSSAGVLPLDGTVIVRSLAISVALTAALLAILKPLVPELPNRAAWLSSVFIAFSLYAIVAGTRTHAGFAAVYTLASGAAAALLVRTRSLRKRKSAALNLAAGAILAVNLYGSAPILRSDERWRSTADALIESVAASGQPPQGVPQRDIYYIVLDAFGRRDVLNELYQLDIGPFVNALEARGFAVPEASQSNYAQTFLSLASSLNLSYLDPIASAMGNSGDRRVLDHLIKNNALTRLAKRGGYQVIAIGSNYAATDRLTTADLCLCEQYGLHEIEATAINLTPLRALPLDRWTYDAHRRKIEQEFRHLEYASSTAGPKLVFAHLISPHPPFVFAPDGRPRANAKHVFGLMDGSHFRGSRAEYVAGYRDQAQFVVNRVLPLIDTILSRPGPSPVIVLHGDHGPGSMWDWDDIASANTRERLAIFSAYRFPEGDPAVLDPHLSPVNGLRMMANRHLGTSLPILPDWSFASGWQHPFQWVAVRSDVQHELSSARR